MNIHKTYAWGSTACVVLAVIVGLFLSGSPNNQRSARFDETRVSELRMLTYNIENYRNQSKRLPKALEELVDGRNLDSLPRDPESKMVYTYSPVSEQSYRLCAEFNDKSEVSEQVSFWDHQAGYHCYEIMLPPLPAQ